MQNDVQVLEGAKVLANNIQQMSLDGQESIEALFTKVLLREPKSEELDLLSDYYEASLEKFEANEEDADKLLEVGEKELNIENKESVAALMMVAQVLYNLDETITKE